MKRYLLITLIAFLLVSVFASTDVFAQEDYDVGVIIPYEVGWFSAFKEGFEVTAEAENVDLNWQYHNYKSNEENKAIQNLITLGVDAINLTAATPSSAQYSSQLANEADIPIQITESGLAEGSGTPFADIDFDWYEIYQFLAESLREDEEGELNILYVAGIAGSPPVMEGIEGLKDKLDEIENAQLATDVQYGDYATEKTLEVVKNIIQSGVEFNVAIGASQEVAEGIIQALDEEDIPLSDVTIVSVNGGPLDIENFKDEELDYAISQSPGFHGMICATNLINYLKGENYVEETYSPVRWVSQEDWEERYIPWEMNEKWLPRAEEFLETGELKM